MAKEKRKRVPEVLWQVFKSRARTLADTILHFIPPQCNCYSTKSNSKCLHCCFHQGSQVDPLSYLLRPDDPSDYRILLTRTFVVVPLDAPPFPSNSRYAVHWPILQIVTRTVHKIFIEQPGSSNMICCGCDKLFKNMGANAELLTSPAWDLVLNRVGEQLLVYLFCYTSIFLPIPCGKYQQVTGFPSRKPIPEPMSLSVSVQKGSRRKRRRKNTDCSSREELSCVLSSQIEGSNNSGLSDVSETRNEGIFSGDKYTDEGSQTHEISNAKPRPRKRPRLPSWLRKRIKSCDANMGVHMERNQLDKSITVGNDHINLEHVSKELQGDQNGHKVSILQEDQSVLSCCSIFQASKGVSKGEPIKRSYLYNMESSPSLLPKKHMLNSLKVDFGGADFLIREIFALPKAKDKVIFKPCSQSKELQSPGSTCMYRSFLKYFKVLICKAQRCKYEMLLDKHCSVPTWLQNEHGDAYTDCRTRTTLPTKRRMSNQPEINLQNKRSKTSTSNCNMSNVVDPQPCLNMCYNSNHQVVSFVWATCRSIVPPDMLGPPSSQRALTRNISKFIQLRRCEKFSLKQCMSKLKMSEFPAFSSKSYLGCWKGEMLGGGNTDCASRLRHKLFERWICWLFSHLVAPTIQAHFYVTESEHGKQELYYYRKSVWKKINDQAIACLKAQSYESINVMQVKHIVSKRDFGFSKLRLCPKETGVRVIANLAAPSRYCKGELRIGVTNQNRRMKNDQFGYLKSVNHFLRDTHSVLRSLKIKEPENWGSSVFSYNDVYRKICPFLMSVKKRMKDMPSLFIVVSDVEKAFDTVNQDKLLKIVDEILIKDEYLLPESYEIVCKKKSLRDFNISRLMNQLKSSVSSRPGNTIVVDQEKNRSVRKNTMCLYLNDLVKHNLLHVDQCFLLQRVGIPQGSSVAPLLCSLYLGSMERKHIFPLLEREIGYVDEATPKYTLLRFIDDFLFISTSKRLAEKFLSKMGKGFEEYNCNMNKHKFSLNFGMGYSTEIKPKSLVQGDDGNSFVQWSGLLLNCHTLEIQADYTRYMNNHLSSTLRICYQGKPGRELKEKLRVYLRPKSHPILFDSNINSRATVMLNVYQIFLLCAMKFHCSVRELSSVNKFRHEFYFTAIDKSIRYEHKLIKRRMKAATASCEWKPILELSKGETIWLGLTAYIRVLTIKQSRYKRLLRLLRSELAAREIDPCLMSVVDDKHSSWFWKMKF